MLITDYNVVDVANLKMMLMMMMVIIMKIIRKTFLFDDNLVIIIMLSIYDYSITMMVMITDDDKNDCR